MSVCMDSLKSSKNDLLAGFISKFKVKTIHKWNCQFMRNTMVQIPCPDIISSAINLTLGTTYLVTGLIIEVAILAEFII